MSHAVTTRTRRRRRQVKAVLKHGKAAKPTHKLLSGRSGSVGAKRRGTR